MRGQLRGKREVKMLRRVCKKCGKWFDPVGKFQRYCLICYDKNYGRLANKL